MEFNIEKEYEDFILLDSKRFYPFHYSEEFTIDSMTTETNAIHWWNHSWNEENRSLDFLRFKHLTGIRKFIIDAIKKMNLMVIAFKYNKSRHFIRLLSGV